MARKHKTNHIMTKDKKSNNEYLKVIPGNLEYDKSGISNHWGKSGLFNQVPGQLDSQLEENINSYLYSMPYKRKNSKCIGFLSS